jgi:metallo-beta-lactamase family protein
MDLQFFGAAQQVTGSCFLLRVAGKRILVECGLFQGPPEVEAKNRQPFPFDPAGIDAVVLTHAHLDHSGRLPLLVKAGFQGPIYAHNATRDLCRILLKDAAYLNEKEVEWSNHKRQRKGLSLLEPLYTMQDATVAMRRFHGLKYGERRTLFPGIKVRMQDAGHILGSAITEVFVEENGVQRKLVFSGDLGHKGAPILRDPVMVKEADLVIMESTYGDRLHRPWDETWQELAHVLKESLRAKGNVLIPSFAVGRSQEILYAFTQHFEGWGLKDWNIFLDSPLAIEATNIYARHAELYDTDAVNLKHYNGNIFGLPNLRLTRTSLQSMAINRIRSGAIIIAGSGMCNGGRIKHHFKHNLWRSNCHVLMVGFQAEGTLGRALVDGAEQIQLWGETIHVGAKIHTIGGFSAHADQQGLLDWYGHIENRPPLVLVHGEPDAIGALKNKIKQQWQTSAHIAQEGERLELSHLKWQ